MLRKKIALKSTGIQVDVERLAFFIHSFFIIPENLKELDAVCNKIGHFVILHKILFVKFKIRFDN